MATDSTKPGIQEVKVAEIDPQSTVNVRATIVEEDVKMIAESIEREGYHIDFPVRLRPHPKPEESGYKYENIAGQTRIEAARKMELETIPAIVAGMDDESAKKFSWNENDKRNQIPESRKAELFEETYRQFLGKFNRKTKAHEATADFYSVSASTVRKTLPLILLPEEVARDHDAGIISKEAAVAIAGCHDPQDEAGSQDRMLTRHSWFKDKDSSERKQATAVLKDAGSKAGRAELDSAFEEKANVQGNRVNLIVPSDWKGPMEQYRRRNGFTDNVNAVQHAVATALRGEGLI